MIKKKYLAKKPEMRNIVKIKASSVAAIDRLRFLGLVFLSLRDDLKKIKLTSFLMDPEEQL